MKDSEVNPIASAHDAFHRGMRDLLEVEARALDALIQDLAPHPGPVVEIDHGTRCVVWMLQAIGVSLHSVRRLTEARDMAIRDCFGIARSAAETAVNVAYIAVSGDSAAERAVRHGRQKRWRDLHREGVLGGDMTISVRRVVDTSLEDIPGLADDIKEFSTKNGSEVRDWTPLTIQQRIEQIHSASPQAAKLLGAAIFSIYRPSSELLHGTFYGVNYFWQGSRGSVVRSAEEFDRLWIEEHLVTLGSALVFAAAGAIEAVATSRGLKAFAEHQQSVLRALEELTPGLASTSDCGHKFKAEARKR